MKVKEIQQKLRQMGWDWVVHRGDDFDPLTLHPNCKVIELFRADGREITPDLTSLFVFRGWREALRMAKIYGKEE